MQRCIEIAKQGISLASPNPSVGAVLVYKDKIIGEGYTAVYGSAHAEVNCIESVAKENKRLIQKATLYVSLEPCSHTGKTPACSKRIVSEKIPKVIVGALDPNPLVAGNGLRMLEQNNIQVKTGILEKECKQVNKRFFTFFEKKRPYIILKWAQTPNGYFAPIDTQQFWITNKYSKQLVHKWRTENMAILVGLHTARIDNPRLDARLYKGKNPIRIVIDEKAELDNSLYLFNKKANTIIFNARKNETQDNIRWIQLNFEKNVEQQILDALFQNNINSLLIEGGLETLNQFIALDLWDEARIFTGANELENGIKAPPISGKEILHKKLKNDHLNILKNKTKL